MYERILVPLDGSALAEQVLPYVRLLGKALQSPIQILRAFDAIPQELADPAHGRYIDQISAAFRAQAQESLEQYRAYLSDLGVAVSSTVHEADPAYHILDEAERRPGTLITMSTHGRSGVSRWVLGSVTDKVLRATTNPLLIIRARPLEEFSPATVATRSERWATAVNIDTIIVPVDGSSLAEQVFPDVVTLSKVLDAKVRPVRVITGDGEDTEALTYLGEVSEGLRQKGALVAEERLLRGDPADAIIEMAQQIRDCLIAVTTRGRSGVERWILGSVTDRVVRFSGVPVLVIRPAP